MSHLAIATMSREERADLIGVPIELFDEIQAAAMKVGRAGAPWPGALAKSAPVAASLKPTLRALFEPRNRPVRAASRSSRMAR
jgi:hypothetical protein